MKKVFIDGSAGTTGLRIYERLKERKDLILLTLPDELRKDESARKDAFSQADIVFFCLPDEAAAEAAEMIGQGGPKIIDTSTAHRTMDGWVYGFPELKGQKEKILASTRIANPGCHATGFIALVAPLIENGLLSPAESLTCFSLTGYSGGGKKMIAQYEGEDASPLLKAPRQYGLSQSHKHLKEMKKLCGLETAPIFCPIVAPYYAGMEVTIPLFASQIKGKAADIKEIFSAYYTGSVVRYQEKAEEGGFSSANAFEGLDSLEITVQGNEDRILLIARFDNLGKGASGAAIQNMNLLLGVDEYMGLRL